MALTLFIAGACIFGMLGILHLLYTLFTNKFHATDEQANKLMRESRLVLTKETSIWKAWYGFNVSHSYGAILLPAVYIPLCLAHFHVLSESDWLRWLPVVVGLLYLYLAKQYWFRVPFYGILLATFCFLGAAIALSF